MRKRIWIFLGALAAGLVMAAAFHSHISGQNAHETQAAQPTWVPFGEYPVDIPDTIPRGDWIVPIEKYLRHKDPITAGSTWISPYDDERWTTRGYQPVFDDEEP